jgi:alkylation response protein AidB-like acyl-CoA dehydrogenase
MRRAQSLRILLGSTAIWRRRVASLTIDGVRRVLGIDLPAEAEAIRADIRSELADATSLDTSERASYLADRGYTAPHFAEPWGKGAEAVTQLVIAEELRAAALEPHDMIIGNWVVPTLIAHGDDQQLQRFVPPSLRGDIVWCQLFSEPGAGSDLAGLSTKATKVDGGWRLQGQKVWTSGARDAHWGICLARTDGDAAKHKGLSYFLVDIQNSPGLDIRPLREITGESLFNEVFLDDVFVPDDCVVGELNNGWRLARTTLANERVAMGGSALGKEMEALLAQIEGRPLDAVESAELGELIVQAQLGQVLDLRAVLGSINGTDPGAASSVRKLIGVRHRQAVPEFGQRLRGLDGLEYSEMADEFLLNRCLSIAGGTTQILATAAAERLLGLPR